MKTSVLIALLAVSFTAVIAAPQHHGVFVHKIHANTLKQTAFPKIEIAPKSAIGDLIELMIGIDVNAIIEQAGLTIAEVEAALNDAAKQLVDLSTRVDEQLAQELQVVINAAVEEALVIAQPLLDVVNKLIPGASHHRALISPNGLIDELLKLLIGLTVEELTTLVETTVADLEALAGKTLAAIDAIAARLSKELKVETDRIIAEAEARIVAAVQSLLDLLTPIFPPAQSSSTPAAVDIPELINAVSDSLITIKFRVRVARSSVLKIIANTPVRNTVKAIIVTAEGDALATFEAANARLLTTPAEEIPALVQDTIDVLMGIFGDAGTEVFGVVENKATACLGEVMGIAYGLYSNLIIAVTPVVELISSSESNAVVALRNFHQRRVLRYTV